MLDRGSPVPIYHQMKEDLVKMIRDKTFKAGEKLYTESELCKKYEVSAITAKRVLNELAQEGYISRYPGKGSFVNQASPISHELSNFYSFTQEVRRKDMVPASELVRFACVEPSEGCRDFFGLESGERVLLIQRKRFAGGEFITLDFSFVKSSGAEYITKQALESHSLYEILGAHGAVPDEAVESFEAATLKREDAALMGMKAGTAVLKVNRKTFSKGVPLEYNYRYYAPEKYIYSIRLKVGK